VNNLLSRGIVDKDGNAVAVTYSLNSAFGALVIAGNTGFFLDDVMDDFAERANEYRARIGVDHFPQNGEDYLRALIELAKDTAGM